MSDVQPYKVTPIFDEASLPDGLRNAHSTKAGVWGLLRVLEGEIDLVFHDSADVVRAAPDQPSLIAPEALHHVETSVPVRFQVEFYRQPPAVGTTQP